MSVSTRKRSIKAPAISQIVSELLAFIPTIILPKSDLPTSICAVTLFSSNCQTIICAVTLPKKCDSQSFTRYSFHRSSIRSSFAENISIRARIEIGLKVVPVELHLSTIKLKDWIPLNQHPHLMYVSLRIFINSLILTSIT